MLGEQQASWTAETCSCLLRRLNAISEEVTAAIRAELPGYQAMPEDAHRADVRRQLELVLTGIRDGRRPRRSDLIAADALGRRRADEGLAVSTLLQAFEIAIQALWRCFTAERGEDPRAADELIELTPIFWTWMHQLGGAAADGHQVIAASKLAGDAQLRRRLVELIITDPHGAECAAAAAELGMDPTGSFRATAFVPAAEPRDLERLQLRLQIDVGGALAAQNGDEFIVLEQRDRHEVVEGLVRPVARGPVLGFGQRRAGLDGARLSIGDAVLAVRLGLRLGHDVDFEDHWLLATVLSRAEHLNGLDAGVQAATANAHLASTVLAYAACGCSSASTARTQHMHANTVAYRLQRWQQLTGWSLQEFEGLARSVVAIRLSGAATHQAREGATVPPA